MPIKNPLTTPDGISYDEESLKGLIARGNFVDPTTRNVFRPDQLVPNTNLLKYIENWLDNHPEQEFSAKYLDIEF